MNFAPYEPSKTLFILWYKFPCIKNNITFADEMNDYPAYKDFSKKSRI